MFWAALMTKKLGIGKGNSAKQHQSMHLWVLTEAFATRACCHCRLGLESGVGPPAAGRPAAHCTLVKALRKSTPRAGFTGACEKQGKQLLAARLCLLLAEEALALLRWPPERS